MIAYRDEAMAPALPSYLRVFEQAKVMTPRMDAAGDVENSWQPCWDAHDSATRIQDTSSFGELRMYHTEILGIGPKERNSEYPSLNHRRRRPTKCQHVIGPVLINDCNVTKGCGGNVTTRKPNPCADTMEGVNTGT